MAEWIDIGHGFSYSFIGWAPDRDIPANAERFKDIPDIPRVGALIKCPHETEGMIYFDTPEVREVFAHGPFWTVISYKPLHVEPSILRRECQCHGFIRDDKWIPA